jgi:hypothetical protein
MLGPLLPWMIAVKAITPALAGQLNLLQYGSCSASRLFARKTFGFDRRREVRLWPSTAYPARRRTKWYGPDKPFFDKTWKLPNIEKVSN